MTGQIMLLLPPPTETLPGSPKANRKVLYAHHQALAEALAQSLGDAKLELNVLEAVGAIIVTGQESDLAELANSAVLIKLGIRVAESSTFEAHRR